MRGRPPVAPTQHFKNPSYSDEDEVDDSVGELGTLAPARPNKDYTPLSWEAYFDRQEWLEGTPLYWSGSSGPVFLCLHGGGHSAMSYACLAKELKSIECRVVAFDYRAHGQNRTRVDEYDLSAGRLVADTLEVLGHVRYVTSANIVLVGHSMGGAIATRAALAWETSGNALSGLIVLDVVEGSAIDALPFMEGIINSRPARFESPSKAVEWALRSNTLRNIESARLSMPSQIVQDPSGPGFVWRTNLLASQSYWEGWFRGLTHCFLSVNTIKELVVADSDRLDREMMIAQMQGKYKHCILHNVGHILQEDNPRGLAHQLSAFLKTYRVV
jgi:protein phosphatase methylesterase 1